MQTAFFLIPVRQLRQCSATWRLLLWVTLLLSCANLQAAEKPQQWLSPLLQEHPLTGLIIETRGGQPISFSELIQRLDQNDFILIGEKHDNPDHHRLELQLLRSLLQSKPYQVVLEMLDEQQEQGLAALPPGEGTPAQTIRQQLSWDQRGWLWDDYGELIRLSLAQADRLRSGNISRPLLLQIYRQNSDAVLNQPRFQTLTAIRPAQVETIRQQVFESHCGSLPMEHTQPMATIQIARDASMAFALQQAARENKPAILIAGAFHIRQDLGVPAHLRASGSNNLTTIRLTEVEQGNDHWRDYPDQSDRPDYLWFTPKFTDKDYCDSLRK